MSVFLMPFLKLLSVGADLSSQLNFGPERVFAVFCSVETFLSEVYVSEVIVCVTNVK